VKSFTSYECSPQGTRLSIASIESFGVFADFGLGGVAWHAGDKRHAMNRTWVPPRVSLPV